MNDEQAISDKRFVCFGEVLLRLTAPRNERFTQARSLDLVYGGTECNVAVSLAKFGVETEWIGAVPDNDIGLATLEYVRAYGVGVRNVVKKGTRMGLYFLEMGSSHRPSRVIYDRAGSAFASLKSGDLNWRRILNGASWFHFSGISAAVSPSTALICQEAARNAKEEGLTVSCDLNYRSFLWNAEEAQRTMVPLMENVDVLLGGREDALICLGAGKRVKDKQGIDQYACEEVIKELQERFGISRIGLTMREADSATENRIAGSYFDGKRVHFSPAIPISDIVDRIGGGDAFASGVIYGELCGWEGKKTVDFASAANALAHTIHGDFNLSSLEEVKAATKSPEGGRVRR